MSSQRQPTPSSLEDDLRDPPGDAPNRAAEDEGRRDVIGSSGQSRIEQIARRAHQIYEARGGEHGRAVDDWLQAEREVDGTSGEAGADAARGRSD